jgi:hypothetical protein
MNDRPMTHDEALDLAAGYVLGALEPAEEAAVRAHLRTCPESHDEFAELGGVVPYLADADLELAEPPASLGERIMAAAAADLEARRDDAPPASAAAPAGASAATASASSRDAPIAFPSAAERVARAEARSRTGTMPWLVRIAAVLAIVALGGWNLLLQGELETAREYDRAVAAVIQAASHPDAQTVILTPEGGSGPSGIAAVDADGTVVLAMRDLTPTSGTQVYETWVIAGETPVALGSFTVDADGTAAFRTRPAETPPGALIALTLEPNAGNTAPQGSIVSKGIATEPTG